MARRRYCAAVLATFAAFAGACGEDSGTANGGSSGAPCLVGQTLCNEVCVDLNMDSSNCGMCALACGAATSCVAGQCACQSGLSACPLGCVDVTADASNCGACSNVCPAGQVCSLSECTSGPCAAGLTACGSNCVDITSSVLHCGACDAACGAGQTCNAGTCSGGTATGPCSRTLGTCTAPEVTVTDVNVGVPVTGYGSEWDTEPVPMAIAATPSGGSRVAWLGTDGNAYVAELDCDDQMVGSPISFPAHDLQDIYADDDGGVLLVTRDATGSGTDHCGAGPLCGGTSSPCYDMVLVRFNENGTEEWATKVTNLSDSLAGYDDGARFVWGNYQHHGRIAFDGSNYAAYFCIGITVQNGSCIDIHEGDRMQIVSSSGSPVSGGFEVGCSHSWTTRIVWDPRSSEFVTVCATDRPAGSSGCQIARSPGYETLAPVDCAGEFWGGDVVLASGAGYWTAYTQAGSINLVHFTDSGPDQTIDGAGSADHAKLVSYGASHMLLAWESGSTMTAQVRDANTGAAVGSEFTIGVEDHNYQAFKAYPDGSAAYPGAGSSNTSIRIARVHPCQ